MYTSKAVRVVSVSCVPAAVHGGRCDMGHGPYTALLTTALAPCASAVSLSRHGERKSTPPFQNSSLSIQVGVIRCIQTAPCGPRCSRYIRARGAGPPEAIGEAEGRPRNRSSHPAAQ